MRLALVAMVSGLAFVAPQWQPQTSGVTTTLRGVSAVSDRIAWASGARGTILRTDDGGATWRRLTISDSEQLDFRDVDGVGDRVAYALSVGSGESSRIYKTFDGGATWSLQHGIVVGGDYKLENDANDNAAITSDGGRTWALIRGLSGFRSVVRYLPGAKTWTIVAVGQAVPITRPTMARPGCGSRVQGSTLSASRPAGASGGRRGPKGESLGLPPRTSCVEGPPGSESSARESLFETGSVQRDSTSGSFRMKMRTSPI